MADVVIKKINESFLRIDSNETILQQIYKRYSEQIAGSQFSPAFKNKIWDGRIHLFKQNILPIGFIKDIFVFLDKMKYSYDVVNFDNSEIHEDLDEEWYQENIKDNMKNCPFGIRDYQDNAVRAALINKKCILLSCTSSGKSLMIYNIIKSILKKGHKKVLLIVPNIILIDQMYDDFKNYGWEDLSEVERLGGGYKAEFNTPVLISTWESLQNKEPDFFEDYEGVIVDEAHGSRAKALSNILKYCKNAKYKIGTTGTLPTDKAELLQIRSGLGEVVFEIKSKELIDRGYLTKIQVAGVFLRYNPDFIQKNRDRSYQEEVKMVEEHPDRNKVLDFIIKNTPTEHNMLILINHIKHLNNVEEYIKTNYPDRKVSIISGNTKAKERTEIRTELEDEDGTILLATYGTMSTGVNIPKLHEVVLYADSKSKIKVLQSIGRGLRKHYSKNKIILWDVIDDLSYTTKNGRKIKNYLIKHWNERLSFYGEQEFPVITTGMDL